VTRFDVFNGDADGLCALHQLRLVAPCDSVLVSGPKRDIGLLARVDATAGDEVTVLDVSMATNRAALDRLLARGVRVAYYDHHHAGDVPTHPGLVAHVDASPDVCTSILVDRTLGGAHRPWAVVAAFGDNLGAAARALAGRCTLAAADVERLRVLGESLNYNGYGDDVADLVVHPIELYRTMSRHAHPLSFIESTPVLAVLAGHRRDDLERAMREAPFAELPGATVHLLPDAAWSRRVRGEFANALANRSPGLAHAVVTPNRRGHYTVSLRTPVPGADRLCRAFASGGGRAVAAGIDDLSPAALDAFVACLADAFPAPRA
jgi:hypothetical protein